MENQKNSSEDKNVKLLVDDQIIELSAEESKVARELKRQTEEVQEIVKKMELLPHIGADHSFFAGIE